MQIGIIFALAFSSSEHDARWRVVLLLVFGFVSGVNIGPLVSQVAQVDPYAPLLAFILTAVVFTCFSLAAILAESRKYLFLSGVLSSALLGLVVLSIANIFLNLPGFFALWLWGGLILFSGFVVVDTQLIIARAEDGHLDVVFAALDLFLDALNIFVRILIILNRRKK